MRRWLRVTMLAAVVPLAGCGGGWQEVGVAGDPHAPRPGDTVEVVRRDGAVRSGVLSAVDADSLYGDGWAIAWRDVGDVRPLAGEAPVLDRLTRVTLRDGEVAEGYLVALDADSLTLAATLPQEEFAGTERTRLARSRIASLHQQEDRGGRALGTLGAVVIGLTSLLLILLIIDPIEAPGY